MEDIRLFNGQRNYYMSDDEEDWHDAKDKEDIDEENDDSDSKSSVDLLKEHLEEEDKIKKQEFKKHEKLMTFLHSISFYFTTGMANFSRGSIKRKSDEKATDFTVISYSHIPASILLDDYFLDGVRTSLNRTKSDEHTNQLLSVNYEKSVLDSTPFIFAIMKKDLGRNLRKNIVNRHLINIGTYDLNHQFVIYGLDGQHRMSALYALENNESLKNKYVDLKFYLINSEEEYYTAYIALNSNLPQKNEFEKILQKQNLEFVTIKDKINRFCSANYMRNTGKKPSIEIIRDDSKTENPNPPCIHITTLKKSTKFCQMLQKFGADKLFDKMIKLNKKYAKKDLSFFEFSKKKKKSSRYDNAKKYEFYLGMFQNNKMKFVDDL